MINRLPTKAVHWTESKPRTNPEKSASKSAGKEHVMHRETRRDTNGERKTEVESPAKVINDDAKYDQRNEV